MTDKRRKIIEKINNLTVDFAFFLREDICKTDSDYEYLEEHLDKAFACVPRSSEFPSQIVVAEVNKQAAMKEIEEFVDRITIQKCTNGVGEWETFDEDGSPIETFDTYKEALDSLSEGKD